MVVCPHCNKEISSIKCESMNVDAKKNNQQSSLFPFPLVALFSKKAKTRNVYVCSKCNKILAFDNYYSK